MENHKNNSKQLFSCQTPHERVAVHTAWMRWAETISKPEEQKQCLLLLLRLQIQKAYDSQTIKTECQACVDEGYMTPDTAKMAYDTLCMRSISALNTLRDSVNMRSHTGAIDFKSRKQSRQNRFMFSSGEAYTQWAHALNELTQSLPPSNPPLDPAEDYPMDKPFPLTREDVLTMAEHIGAQHHIITDDTIRRAVSIIARADEHVMTHEDTLSAFLITAAHIAHIDPKIALMHGQTHNHRVIDHGQNLKSETNSLSHPGGISFRQRKTMGDGGKKFFFTGDIVRQEWIAGIMKATADLPRRGKQTSPNDPICQEDVLEIAQAIGTEGMVTDDTIRRAVEARGKGDARLYLHEKKITELLIDQAYDTQKNFKNKSSLLFGHTHN